MQQAPYNSQLVVNLSAIQRNYFNIQHSLAENTAIIPVLKCNAYGLGVGAVAKALLQVDATIPLFAVAQVWEAAALQQEGIFTPILLLGGIPLQNIEYAVGHGIHLTVHHPEIAKAIHQEVVRQGKTNYPVQIKIDTGLHRIGAKPGAELAALAQTLLECPNLIVTGAYTHFVEGEIQNSPLALQQASLYQQGVEQLEHLGMPIAMRHLCASGSSEWLGAGGGNTVRIGRRLFMDAPPLPGCTPSNGGIEECCSWRSQIVALQNLAKGETLGYGGYFTAPKPMEVAVVCVGYGDGLQTQLAGAKATVLVKEQLAYLLDTTMDQCFVDVTGLGSQLGDEVTFFGVSSGGAVLSCQKVAALLQDEGVFFTSLLSNRVERVYRNE